MTDNKRRLKIFVFNDIMIGKAIVDMVERLKEEGAVPPDTEFVASSTEVCNGSLAIKLRSSEFPVREEAMAFDMVDMRGRVTV